ncbi:MAG: trypsin-like peptidase domain-containing protein [Deltaproteobacteria bacterium]|nr:trypsin-like peptidase domain-containing protein [Deltaproteobacteria bacterium]
MARTVSLASVLGLLVGCAVEMEQGPGATPGLGAGTGKVAPVIVGQVNWVEAGTLPADDARRVAGRPVALLWLPAAGSRCTGFLVGMDVLMTNHHCVSSAAEAEGAYAVFDAEAGVPDSMRATYDCSTFLGADADLDFGLLRCQGQPGAQHGVATLSDGAVSNNADVFVVHQNCDYYSDPSCQPDKKVSPGRVTSVGSSELSHSADTLGGSSGSALFDALGRIIGLHHVGIGGDSNGRGSANKAVRMDRILPVLRRDFASIFDAAPPSPPPADPVTPPADPTRDALEPNNDTGSATTIARPFRGDGMFIAGNDRDVFRVTLSRATTLEVSMQFSHAAGDLDLYVFRAGQTGAVAQSAGVSDEETISIGLSAGTYFVMAIGYNGATGAYALSVR